MRFIFSHESSKYIKIIDGVFEIYNDKLFIEKLI